jgi:uncharacterized protein (DUF488 family)
MNKVYTSYFARLEELRKAGIVPVGIAVHPPKWFSGPSLLYLAPRADMLKLASHEYDIRFQNILANLRPVEVKQDIERLQNYFKKDVALLCFEKDWNDCHRKKVAEWLNLKFGWDVTEWNVKAEKSKVMITEQRNLFDI